MRRAFAAGVFVVGVAQATSARAQQPYPQQPYPQQPYPQQPYPQQPYPPPPYQPYPQQPYPQQPYPPPPPPPPPPQQPATPQGTAAEALSNAGGGYNIAVAGGVGVGSVDQGNQYRTTGGGLVLDLAALGMSGAVSGRARLAGLFGGGGGGAEAVYAVEGYIGVGLSPTNGTQFFLRVGGEEYGAKNDEIEASAGMLGAQGGFQAWTKGFGFELGPTAGFAARTEYEPGDESQGRRFWRRMGARGAYGGLVSVISDHFFAHGSLLDVADTSPLWMGEADACISAFYIALCGFGQYWHSVATTPLGDARVVPFTYIGGAIGIGGAAAGAAHSSGSGN